MTLKQLETIYAVMRAGSITAAARSLHVSQPAVSGVIKHAELQLGLRLFDRIAGRLHPTPEALALEPSLQDIFGRLEAVQQTVRELREGRVGRLVVVAPPTLVTALLPQAFAQLRLTSPDLDIAVHSLPNLLAVARVARHEADLGIVYAPVVDEALDAQPLMQSEMVCVVPRGHRFARRRVLGLADLSGERVISTGPRTPLGSLVEASFAAHRLAPPHVSIEASSSLAACLMVSRGVGIALVDRSIEQSRKFPELSFKRLAPALSIEILAVFPRARARSRATSGLIAVMQRQVRQAHRDPRVA